MKIDFEEISLDETENQSSSSKKVKLASRIKNFFSYLFCSTCYQSKCHVESDNGCNTLKDTHSSEFNCKLNYQPNRTINTESTPLSSSN